jgi:hypothetical protein
VAQYEEEKQKHTYVTENVTECKCKDNGKDNGVKKYTLAKEDETDFGRCCDAKHGFTRRKPKQITRC